MPDKIPPTSYSSAWLSPSTTAHQSAVMKADLESWLAGKPHVSFDAFQKLVAPIANDVESFLEIGCGCAVYNSVLTNIAPWIQYTGLDVAPQQVAKAREMFPDGQYVVGRSEELPFPGSAFGLVALSAVIQHLPEYETSIREARRVTQRWILIHRVQATDNPTREFLHAAYGIDLPTREINEGELLEFCAANGLDLVGTQRWGVNAKLKSSNVSFLLERRVED